ncbi:MAG: hypothetical protein VB861_07315 [Planctomycetaceae bacterium]
MAATRHQTDHQTGGQARWLTSRQDRRLNFQSEIPMTGCVKT